MAGKPFTNRVPPPPHPAAAPASAPDPTLAVFAPLARLLSGGDLNTPSGRTQALIDTIYAPAPPAAAPPALAPVAPPPAVIYAPAQPPPAAPAAPPAAPSPAAAPAGGPQQWVQLVTRSGRLVAGQVQEVAVQVQGAAARAPHSRWAAFNWIGYGVLVVSTLWLLVQITVAAVAWTDDHLTTVQYGDPRTTHLSAVFGFPSETALAPTTITAVTAPGVGHIFILPGGRIDKALVLALPLPDDPDGRQAMQLSAKDMDTDGYLDLSVKVRNTTYTYLFDRDKQTLRPPTLAEQDRIAGGGR